ncbi:MAG TPA: aminoglycoside phosphotransferase family protein [Alphaproteobacteria bacterium]|nr:aminoglycoside phosphotransferase family protein [Alphaproteobacteria bacterium]
MVINKDILEDFLKDKFSSSKINFVGEGWDSIAFIVDDNILRFPKKNMDDYKKEQKITDFVRNDIEVQIPKIIIVDNVEYPYTTHKMLLGNGWDVEGINNKPYDLQKNFINDCASFFNSVHKIDKNKIEKEFPGLLKIRKFKLESFDYVNKNLQPFLSDKEISNIYNKYENADIFNSDDIVLLHRDFSGGNSLINKDLHLTGVFDWADANFGNRAYDFQSLYNPKYKDFLKEILHAYELKSGIHVDIEIVIKTSLVDRVNCVCWAIVSTSLGDIKEKEVKKLVKKLEWFL